MQPSTSRTRAQRTNPRWRLPRSRIATRGRAPTPPGGVAKPIHRASPAAVIPIVVLVETLVLSLGGCGGGHPASTAAQVSPRSCLPAVAAESARALGQSKIAITEATSVDAVVTCRYRAAKPAPSGCIGADVVLDMAPSAYQRFERFVVERQQTFVQSGASHVNQAPLEIAGIGLEAVWVPAEHRLVATGGDRFASVAPDCPGAASAQLPLAETLARAALRGAALQPTSQSGA